MCRSGWLLVVVVAVGGTFAAAFAAPPSKPVRKPAPAGLDADKLETFVEAVMADKRGDYDRAVSRYRSAGRDVPEMVYNIADIDRRREDYERAIEGYKKYLQLAPKAPDRAAVERLIAQLAKTPQTIVVDGDDLDAVVFVDGKAVGPSPLVMQVADGPHVVDRIGPTSYQHDRLTAKPMGNKHITAYRDATGNVVLSTNASWGGSWQDGDRMFQMNARFTLPPGRVDTFFFRPGRACSPLSFDVPRDGVVYVFVDAPQEPHANRSGTGCTKIRVTAQKLAFRAVKK